MFCLVSGPARSQPGTSPWAVFAERDLKAIHDTIRDNHPGPVDPQNPHYRDWLEKGLALASAEGRSARTYSDYFRALRRYTNGFEDGHLAIDPVLVPRTTDWAGFVVSADGEGRPVVVSAEADSGVKVGDRIKSCDGRSFDDLMKARVDPYFWNRAIPQVRIGTWAGGLFIANPDERDARLKSCLFSSGAVRLNWRSLPTEQVPKKFAAALSRTGSDFSLKQVDGIWFVRLPRFWFNSAEERTKLEALLEELKVKAPELRKATLVFDVRGMVAATACGAIRIASVLWGVAWTNRIEASFDNSHDVRVSPANKRRIDELLADARQHNDSEALPYWTLVDAAMQRARAEGKPLARIALPPGKPVEPAPPDPVTGRVYLLTNSGCASACLDFADLILHLPGVVQIGGATSADAVYIDVNELPLPSGFANIVYGMKVMRHRVRANNQWYEPKYRWPGGLMTDAAIASWVKSLP